MPGGRGSGGSASAPTGGSSLVLAMDKVVAKGRDLAGDLLEAAPGDIAFDAGEFRIEGTDRRVTLPEVAQAAAEDPTARSRAVMRLSCSKRYSVNSSIFLRSNMFISPSSIPSGARSRTTRPTSLQSSVRDKRWRPPISTASR